jgi:hypothetical protein
MKSRSLLLSFVALSFAMLTGCGAASTPKASAPTMDASWTPPESVDLAIREASKDPVHGTVGSATKNSYRPNREAIPQHGAVHAAIN